MQKEISPKKVKQFKLLTIVVSIAVPLVVAVLFGVKLDVEPLSFLPPIYASINALTAVVLITALVMVKNKKIKIHQRLMQFAIVLSLLFLACYVAYHMTSDSTIFGDSNGDKVLDALDGELPSSTSFLLYYILLFTHIILSIVVIPLVMITYQFAWIGNIARHKKWTRYSYPIWLFVAVSGVVVYWMISPYYIH